MKNQDKVLEVLLACQMCACHKFNKPVEIPEFQNQLSSLEYSVNTINNAWQG